MSSIQSTDSSNLSLIQTLINRNRTQYNTLVEQISSGNKYLKRSDDAADTNKAALISIDGAQNTQFASNVSMASNWETASYSYLDDMSSQFASAVSLATEANNTIEAASGWADIATEVDSLIDSLMADANSKYLGTSLFAGTGTSSTVDPFTIATNASGFEDVTYNGNDTQRSIKTSTAQASSTDYGTTGSSIFGGIVLTNSDGGTTNELSSLQALIDFRDYLNASGSLTADQLTLYQNRYAYSDETTPADITSDQIFNRILSVISAGSTQIAGCKAANSSSSSRLNSLTSSLSTAVSTSETAYSDLVSLDTVKAATDLSNIETVLQASMSLAGNISSMSLVNYM